MNFADIAVAAVVIALLLAAVVTLLRKPASCGGDCARCALACRRQKSRENPRQAAEPGKR